MSPYDNIAAILSDTAPSSAYTIEVPKDFIDICEQYKSDLVDCEQLVKQFKEAKHADQSELVAKLTQELEEAKALIEHLQSKSKCVKTYEEHYYA